MEQSQILSLLAKYEGSSSKTPKSTNWTKTAPPPVDGDTNFQPQPWRTKGPKDGEPLERITKGGHTFKWDPTGNN